MIFALAGNPNSGKTTLFNELTGSTAHVGNWPGVTVERKEGRHKVLGKTVTVVDLPGIYSLSPYSPEEIVARDYILKEKPDLLINIVDATNLERNLYLTTQLLETDIPLVVALNMMDIVKKKDGSVDAAALEKALGVPVVPISALDRADVTQLMERCVSEVKARKGVSVIEGSGMGDAYKKALELLRKNNVPHPSFHAVKLMEGDEVEVRAFVSAELAPLSAQIQEIKKSASLPFEVGDDFEAAVADARYKFVGQSCKNAQKHGIGHGRFSTSDKIDRVLTNRLLGLPIFLFMMYMVFHLTFSDSLFFAPDVMSPGVWLQELMGQAVEYVTEFIGGAVTSAGVSEWVHAMVVDGLLAGLGAVLSFLPQIMMLFLFLSILEDSGYMARVAFLMDRLLRRFGLSGKAFLPMLMGFGCSVPAMMATRTLENERDRRLTVMMMPCFSCGAKAPIWAMFAAALFPQHGDLMIFGVYMIGILTFVVAGILMKRFVFKGEVAPFIMELPAYHLPRLRNVTMNLWQKLRSFLLRASTIIAGATIVIWFLSNFDFSLAMVDANSASSILGVVGNFLLPVFTPLGFASGPDGWKAVVAILTGLIAKEMVVSTMGVLYNPGVEGDALENEAAGTALAATLAATFSPVAALSFMAFNLLSIPCMAAVATARVEMKSGKWFWGTLLFWMSSAWIVSFLIFRVGTLLGF